MPTFDAHLPPCLPQPPALPPLAPHADPELTRARRFFGQEMRAKIIKENPNLSFGEVGKKMGADWAKCKDKSKCECCRFLPIPSDSLRFPPIPSDSLRFLPIP